MLSAILSLSSQKGITVLSIVPEVLNQKKTHFKILKPISIESDILLLDYDFIELIC